MAVGPDGNIKAPKAEVPKHTLLETARVVTDENGVDQTAELIDGRWEAGFTIWLPSCEEPDGFAPCSTGEERVKRPTQTPAIQVHYDPWEAVIPYSCTAAGFPREGYEEILKERFDVGLTKALEREFWTGELIPTNPHLAAEAEILNPGSLTDPTLVSPKMALAMLGQALADCGFGGLGTIHAPPLLVELWCHNSLLEEDDEGRLRTSARGDYVVAGSGYPADPNEPLVAYATGLVEIRLGKPIILPDNFTEAFNRGTNNVTFRMERTVAVSHGGCCTFGVYIQHPYGQDEDGNPVIVCDDSVPTAYSYPFKMSYIEDASGIFGSPTGGLAIGVNKVDVSPAFTGAVSGDLSYFIPGTPLGSPPTTADVPDNDEWTVAESGITDLMYALIPLELANPGPPHGAIWLRISWTEVGGCKTTSFVYIPDFPISTHDEIEAYIKVEELPFQHLALAANDYTPVHFDVTNETGDCPPPKVGVAVIPACGSMPISVRDGDPPIPVAIVSGDPSFPSSFKIAGQVAADQGDPLAVTIAGPDPLPVTFSPGSPVLIDATIVRLTGASGPNTFSNVRSITVVVLAGAPTVNGVAIPTGTNLSWSVEASNEHLNDVIVTTLLGDDVIVTTTVPD